MQYVFNIQKITEKSFVLLKKISQQLLVACIVWMKETKAIRPDTQLLRTTRQQAYKRIAHTISGSGFLFSMFCEVSYALCKH